MQKQSKAGRAGIGRALLRAVGGFRSDRRGGVAAPFALTAIPIAFMSVAAIDFHRAVMVRGALQDALDAAALTVGRSNVLDAQAVQAMGSAALEANWAAYPETTLKNVRFVLDGNTVEGSAAVEMQPVLAQLFGGDMTVAAETEVVRAINKLEIAMVLDNTGSMAGTKLSLLKTAATNFVDTLSVAAARSPDPKAVRIALAPFSMTVNVGSQYRNEAWMDQTGAAPINSQIFSGAANRFTLFQKLGQSWGGCVESRQAPYDIQDTPPDSKTPATLFTPYFAPDEPGSSSKTTAWNNQTWYNSYLSDKTESTSWSTRQKNLAKYTSPEWVKTGTNAVGYQYGPNSGCELQPIVRLTNDWTALKTAISAMTAIGDTNVPFGLVWGWHLLSPNAPFKDGSAYGADKTTKIVVLMTDGQNANADTANSNDSIYSGIGYIWQNRIGISSGTATQRRTALDNRLALLCQNMKAKGVVIYTVRVEVNDNAYKVLQDCASSRDKFYDVKSASELNTVFNAIAGDIQNLRIAR